MENLDIKENWEEKLPPASITAQLKVALLNQQKPLKEKIKQLLNDEILIENVKDLMRDMGIKKPIISLTLSPINTSDENNVILELDYTDLLDFFSHFGKLERISLKKRSEAYIYFKEHLSAYVAQKLLDNHEFKEINAQMHVKFCDYLEETLENFADTQSSFQFCCKFEININDLSYNVERRIRGAKNCNLSRIKELSCKGAPVSHPEEILEIDIRNGIPSEKENEKFVYFLINSKYPERYKLALKLAHELLANIYEEYKLYCDENNVGYPNDLKIKKTEYILNDCPIVFSETDKIEKMEKLSQTPNTN